MICGPYELTKGDKKRSYCIMGDNSISVRTYHKDVFTKQKNIQKGDVMSCMDKFNEIHKHKLANKGYTVAGLLGKRKAPSDVGAPPTKAVRTSSRQK